MGKKTETTPTKELVTEHKRLVSALRSHNPAREDAEANRQEKELHHYEKDAMKKNEKGTNVKLPLEKSKWPVPGEVPPNGDKSELNKSMKLRIAEFRTRHKLEKSKWQVPGEVPPSGDKASMEKSWPVPGEVPPSGEKKELAKSAGCALKKEDPTKRSALKEQQGAGERGVNAPHHVNARKASHYAGKQIAGQSAAGVHTRRATHMGNAYRAGGSSNELIGQDAQHARDKAKELHRDTLNELRAQKKPDLGKATGHETGVHAELGDSKLDRGRSPAGDYVRGGHPEQARQMHEKHLAELKAMPKPALDKSAGDGCKYCARLADWRAYRSEQLQKDDPQLGGPDSLAGGGLSVDPSKADAISNSFKNSFGFGKSKADVAKEGEELGKPLPRAAEARPARSTQGTKVAGSELSHARGNLRKAKEYVPQKKVQNFNLNGPKMPKVMMPPVPKVPDPSIKISTADPVKKSQLVTEGATDRAAEKEATRDTKKAQKQVIQDLKQEAIDAVSTKGGKKYDGKLVPKKTLRSVKDKPANRPMNAAKE